MYTIIYQITIFNMKRSYAVIIAIIVCIISLWIGFYFGKLNQDSNNLGNLPNLNTKSNFDKQTQCASYYNVYKDKLSYVDDSKTSSINSLSVSYSPSLDNCVASWVESLDIDNDWISDYYDFNIVNASRWDLELYKCTTAVLKQDDKCSLQKWRDYLYDLTTYSNVIDDNYE